MVYCPHDLLGKEGERVTRTRWWWWLWGKQLAWGWHEESRRKTRRLDIKGSPRECARLLSVVSWGQPAPRETSCGASARLSPVQRFVKREEKRTQIRETARNKNSGFEIGTKKVNILTILTALPENKYISKLSRFSWMKSISLTKPKPPYGAALAGSWGKDGTFWGVFNVSHRIWRSVQVGYC